jgi:hypothetical protein
MATGYWLFLIQKIKMSTLKKTIEEVISVTVASGTSSVTSVPSFLPGGKITHVAAFFRDYAAINTGLVRASIKDVNGNEVSQMQSIENYRDREAGYLAGKKPLPMNGGNNFTVTIQATANFSAAFNVDFVFVYEDDNCDPKY